MQHCKYCISREGQRATINDSTFSTTTDTACDSLIWHGTTYNSSGTYTHDAGTNAAGCYSTSILHLTIHYSTAGDTTATACYGFTWYGNNYTSSGSHIHLFTNA